MKETVEYLFRKIHEIEDGKSDFIAFPERTFELEDGHIICFERKFGESRFPYGHDGFYLWAHSSGYVYAHESTFYVFPQAIEGKEPYINFYAIINGMPVSLLGVGRNALEKDVKRCCVYSKACVYYLTEVGENRFAVRFFMNENKNIVVSLFCLNDDSSDIKLSSYFNPLFKYQNAECSETKWFKKSTYKDNSFLFESPEDLDRKTHIENYGKIQRFISDESIITHNTTARMDYAGGKSTSLENSSSLLNGKFELNKEVTLFTDTAIAGDIIDVDKIKESQVDYIISFSHSKKEIKNGDNFDIEGYLAIKENEWAKRKNEGNLIQFRFEDWKDGKLDPKTLNAFLDNVVYQVEYCALAKNSGTIFLGVRDVLQQIEALLMWDPDNAKKKLLEVISTISSNGIPPRQYSLPPEGCDIARMDQRQFIDQPVWLISTIYTYLAFTDDYSILDEQCDYFEPIGPGLAKRASFKESVLEHMFKLMGYLSSNIDDETKCLRTLYGDWNDALDGLGASLDPNKEYGNGVSVMASCQFYQNLVEMIDILKHIGGYDDKLQEYELTKKSLSEGLLKNAIKEKDGHRRIVHGWGDKQSYYVGSYNDVDGFERDSLTANSFFILSGLYKKEESLKGDMLEAFHRLDSKYGMMTFNPGFDVDVKGVGRIVYLPKGTAENGATYVHATMFGIDALCKLGEYEYAIEQLERVLPITHSHISTTPFVMSNSYVHNPEIGADGESMSDWYTGSSCVLIKSMVHSFFGVKVDLDGVNIDMPEYTPAKEMSLSLKIKGKRVNIHYKDGDNKFRIISVNGEVLDSKSVYLDKSTLKNGDIAIDIAD